MGQNIPRSRLTELNEILEPDPIHSRWERMKKHRSKTDNYLLL